MSDPRHREIEHLLNVASRAQDGNTMQLAYAQARRLIAECDQGVGGNPQYSGGASRVPYDVGHSIISTDQVHPPNPADVIIPMMAPSRYLVLPNPPAVAPGTTSGGTRLEFSAGGGWLIGWRGSVRDDTPGVEAAGEYERASLGIRMFINDGEELITNGTGADFATLADLFPRFAPDAPILRRVDVKDILTVLFQNQQPVATGNTLQPTNTKFAFWREKYPGTG